MNKLEVILTAQKTEVSRALDWLEEDPFKAWFEIHQYFLAREKQINKDLTKAKESKK